MRNGPEDEEDSGSGARILLVDDEPVVRAVTRSMLQSAGYHVLEAGDGQEALGRFALERVDLLLTDVEMPRMGGRELAERVWERHPDLPVLFCSDRGAPTPDAVPGGRHALLTKPFLSSELLQAVARTLGRRGPGPGRSR